MVVTWIQELAETTTNLEQQTPHFLPGAMAPRAASDLQQVVKGVLSAANFDLRSERVLPPPSELGGLQEEVPIELSVAGSIRDTVKLLSLKERTNRLLTVKDVKARVVTVGQPRELPTTLTAAGCLLPATVTN